MTLSEAEEDELNGFLARVKGGAIPNVEALDGFFAALICCSEPIRPSEWMSIIQSGLVFENEVEAQYFMLLVQKYFLGISSLFENKEIYVPLLGEKGSGRGGEDWAKGFMAGTKLRPEIWSGLINDEDQNGLILPILILAHENDPDPERRPLETPMDTKQRQGVIAMAAAAVMGMYDYFRESRPPRWLLDDDASYIRKTPKVGRNEPCPCGSGKKFKRCCAKAEPIH